MEFAESSPGLGGYVGECAVAVVAIEPVLSEIGEEEIFEAIVVVVAHAHSHRPAGIDQSPAFSVTSVNVPSRLLW
jgi:hypothetical protein